MNCEFSPNQLRSIARDFKRAVVISDRLKGSFRHQNDYSIVVLNSISGSVCLFSESGSILIGGKISGSVNLVAYQNIIIQGKISGSVKILARTGNIFLMDKVRGSALLNAPYGKVLHLN